MTRLFLITCLLTLAIPAKATHAYFQEGSRPKGDNKQVTQEFGDAICYGGKTIEELRELIKAGANVNGKARLSGLPFIVVALQDYLENGNKAPFDLLLEHKCDVNAQSFHGKTDLKTPTAAMHAANLKHFVTGVIVPAKIKADVAHQYRNNSAAAEKSYREAEKLYELATGKAASGEGGILDRAAIAMRALQKAGANLDLRGSFSQFSDPQSAVDLAGAPIGSDWIQRLNDTDRRRLTELRRFIQRRE